MFCFATLFPLTKCENKTHKFHDRVQDGPGELGLRRRVRCRDGRHGGEGDGGGEVAGVKRGREGEEDAMAALEDRAREMDADAALEEARSLGARRAGVSAEQLLESLNRNPGHSGKAREELDQADEELVKSVSFRGSMAGQVKRIEEEDGDEEDFFEACLARAVANLQAHKKQGQEAASSLPNVSKRIRRMPVASHGKAKGDVAEMPEQAKASGGALQVLCCSYGDEEESRSPRSCRVQTSMDRDMVQAYV